MEFTRTAALLAALAMAAAPLAWGHDDATLDTIKSPNGGQTRATGIYHFELVVAPPGKEARNAPVAVFVTDHAGTQVPTAGATGTATILSGAQKTTITLQPGAGNQMKGQGVYLSNPEMKVVVTLALAGKTAESARFTPLARMALGGPVSAGAAR